MAKAKRTKDDGRKPALVVPLFRSLWGDEGRRVLSVLALIVVVALIVVLVVNGIYRPYYELGMFMSLDQMQANVNRLFMPTGFLLTVISILLFSISKTYGKYTEVSVGKISIGARDFFKRLSFYLVLLGAAFLLSSGVASSIVGYSGHA